MRTCRLVAQESADNEPRDFEESEAKNLRQESELFPARQTDGTHVSQEEQRKALGWRRSRSPERFFGFGSNRQNRNFRRGEDIGIRALRKKKK
jgi:hypothetical protein